ncbi:MAG: hydrogenase maturation nickel metallochaperone HypA [Halothiobacillaceae bacterium]
MHELSVCRALIRQLESLAQEHGGGSLRGVTLRIGPLGGIDPALLAHAFAIARQGSCAEDAVLTIETAAIRVRCRDCGQTGEATTNRLACSHCGSHRTQLLGGDEMLITSIELQEEPDHV